MQVPRTDKQPTKQTAPNVGGGRRGRGSRRGMDATPGTYRSQRLAVAETRCRLFRKFAEQSLTLHASQRLAVAETRCDLSGAMHQIDEKPRRNDSRSLRLVAGPSRFLIETLILGRNDSRSLRLVAGATPPRSPAARALEATPPPRAVHHRRRGWRSHRGTRSSRTHSAAPAGRHRTARHAAHHVGARWSLVAAPGGRRWRSR